MSSLKAILISTWVWWVEFIESSNEVDDNPLQCLDYHGKYLNIFGQLKFMIGNEGNVLKYRDQSIHIKLCQY